MKLCEWQWITMLPMRAFVDGLHCKEIEVSRAKVWTKEKFSFVLRQQPSTKHCASISYPWYPFSYLLVPSESFQTDFDQTTSSSTHSQELTLCCRSSLSVLFDRRFSSRRFLTLSSDFIRFTSSLFQYLASSINWKDGSDPRRLRFHFFSCSSSPYKGTSQHPQRPKGYSRNHRQVDLTVGREF